MKLRSVFSYANIRSVHIFTKIRSVCNFCSAVLELHGRETDR